MMRTIILYIILIGTFISCEDVIEVDVPSSEPRLNIDANFSVFTDEMPIRLAGSVKLSMTADFFEDVLPKVSDATVFITNTTTGEVFNFSEEDSGNYLPENTNLFSTLEDVFELTIIYNNETYTGQTRFVPVAPITSIEQGDDFLLNEDDIEILVRFTDDGTREDYALFDFGFDLYRPVQDRFYQGQDFVFSYFYFDDDNFVSPGDQITVIANGIDEAYHTYIELVIDQSGDGGPFPTAPATPIGNMVNETNSENYPLGYFRVSEADEKTVLIE